MKQLNEWTHLFTRMGLTFEAVKSNPSAVTLTNVPGAPVFKVVASCAELNNLHSKAREKSQEMGRILVVALPLNHVQTVAAMPGSLYLPKVRVYGGHAGSTFSLSGHKIESTLLTSLKKEVSSVIANGTKVKTPLISWLLKLAGTSWPYGVPSSVQQLDSLLQLVSRDVQRIGHARVRELSFGRGCGESLLLPMEGVVLSNNGFNNAVTPADFRFISMAIEHSNHSSARQRIHAQYSDAYLSTVAEFDEDFAESLGCNALIGTSQVGSKPEVTATKKSVVVAPAVKVNSAMANV